MDITSEMLSDILYEKEIGEITELMGKTDDPTLMHMIAYNYNWDNGLDVPKRIINNPHCDAGTALIIFELAEGYEFLLGEECVSDIQFLQKLKDILTDGKFANNKIRYVPELDRMQKYRLKKSIPDIPAVFLDGTGGDDIEMITV